MKKNKLIKSVISWVLYIAILVGLVWSIPKGLSYFLKTPYPMASITSSSMWPALKEGDLVFIKGIENKEEVNVGDIVVYENYQGFTIHRVIRKGDDFLVTKGDANNTADPVIKYSELVGKAVFINGKVLRLPGLGSISLAINKVEI